MKEAIALGISAVVAVFIISTLITSGDLGGQLVDVDTDSEWTDAIDDSESSNYEVTNDSLVLEDNGDVLTETYDIDGEEDVEGTINVSEGDVTATVTDEDDEEVYSETTSGEEELTFQPDEDVENITVQYENEQTEDSTVDSYEVEASQEEVGSMFRLMIIAVLGTALIAILNY